ncbi:MAG: hypothetical protein KGD74_02455 [Candidatus Lokiarchaeota archaeon]|nr:hypothetical protein [Candidatus Lokiarchaeota archaeon]
MTFQNAEKILSGIIKYKKFHKALNLDLRYIDKNYILSEVYKNIGIKVRYMNPEEFKRSYKGPYSHYFNKIKDSHNRYLGIQTVGNLLKLMKKMNYYGVIYKITQVKNENGDKIHDGPVLVVNVKKIKNGYVRIGRAIELYDRLTHYISTSETERAKYHFELALRKYGIKSFRIEILAVCKSKKEYIATEYFWQLYFNRKNNEEGFDININKRFNPTFGSRGDEIERYHIPKWELVKFILQDMNKKDIREYYGNKYKVQGKYKSKTHYMISLSALNTRLLKYFGTIDLLKIQRMLVNPSLDLWFKRGYTLEEALVYLDAQGIKFYQTSSNPKYQKDKLTRHAVKIHGDILNEIYLELKSRRSGRYEAIRIKLFIIPFVNYLKSIDIKKTIDTPIMIRDPNSGLFISRTDIELSELSIIEHLVLKYVDPIEIAIQIDMCERNDNIDIKAKCGKQITTYLINRWSYTMEQARIEFSIENLRRFLNTHNLNNQIYLDYNN